MEQKIIEEIIHKDKKNRTNVCEMIQKHGWSTVIDELDNAIPYLDRKEIEDALFEYLRL